MSNAGAEGYLLKEDADIEMFAAIGMIRRGGRYLSFSIGSSSLYPFSISSTRQPTLPKRPNMGCRQDQDSAALLASYRNLLFCDHILFSCKRINK